MSFMAWSLNTLIGHGPIYGSLKVRDETITAWGLLLWPETTQCFVEETWPINHLIIIHENENHFAVHPPFSIKKIRPKGTIQSSAGRNERVNRHFEALLTCLI